MSEKLPISAIVVTYNEEKYLEQCLKSIWFCDEIIVIDLGSGDYSIEIAEKYATKQINHERVQIVEIIHSKYYKETKHDWILITDPDEVTKHDLSNEILNIFSCVIEDKKIGVVRVPLLFFFKEMKLKGTVWGGVNSRVFLIHKNRFVFKPYVHQGRQLKEGYAEHIIKFKGNNYIAHYWMQGYKQLFDKHKRYIKKEGEAMYSNGQRYIGKKQQLKQFYMAFKKCFFEKKGYRDKFTGLMLSIFYAWYVFESCNSLKKYQENQSINS